MSTWERLLRTPLHGPRVVVRAVDTVADLVSILCVVQRADGRQYTAGLLAIPQEDWWGWIRPAVHSVQPLLGAYLLFHDETLPPEPEQFARERAHPPTGDGGRPVPHP